MDDFVEFLSKTLIVVGEQTITVGQVIAVPAVVLFGYILIRWIGRFISSRMTAKNVNADVVQLISRAFYIVGIAILAITTLDLLNVPLTAFAFVSGAVAIGVGFGAQNIINNFISGWILMAERPIRIGDFIEIDNWQAVYRDTGSLAAYEYPRKYTDG